MEAIIKEKIIFDVDPGVDDAAALSLSLYDRIMDVILVTTVSGNRDIGVVTRNALHLLDIFNRADIPLAVGASTALNRIGSEDARNVHKFEGLGGYIPPQTTPNKPIALDAVEAMYQAIKKHRHNISIIAVGPHTNVASLIIKHPDVKNMLNHIYTEGCSPYGWGRDKKWREYISFNARTDPEALKIVLESGIPVTLVPSQVGRERGFLTEKEALKIRDINTVGEWLYEMFDGYWEHGYKDKRIALNDTCACLTMREPSIFKTKKVLVTVNTTDMPGKTEFKVVKNSNIELAVNANRHKLYKCFYRAVSKLDRFNFSKEIERSKLERASRYGAID